MINIFAKLILLLFSSSSLAVTVAVLSFFAGANLGDIIYFSGLIFIGLPVFVFAKKILCIIYIAIICCTITSTLLVTLAVTNFKVADNVFKLGAYLNINWKFFIYYIIIFTIVFLCGLIAMHQYKSSAIS